MKLYKVNIFYFNKTINIMMNLKAFKIKFKILSYGNKMTYIN